MDLQQLELFVRVAEQLHFRKAAESIPVAQSTLSRQIRRLEDEVGTELVIRTTRRVELSPAGVLFLEVAKSMLQQADAGIRAAQRAAEGEIGRLRVGFGGSVTYGLMPRITRAFKAMHPDVNLELFSEMVTRTQVEDLLGGRLDVGFLRPPVSGHNLVVEVIRTEQLVLAVFDQHPRAHHEIVDLGWFSNDPFVSYPGSSGASVYASMVTACNNAGFSPQIVQEATETHTLVSFVAAGLGVALLPEAVRALQIPGVLYREFHDTESSIELALAWIEGAQPTPLQHFIQIARNVADDG